MGKRSSKESLARMVKGAARAAEAARPGKAEGLAKDVVKSLLKHIDLHGKTVQKIPCHLIDLDDNIRTSYSNESLKQLAESLKADGLIQFPTLCLKKRGSAYSLLCRNGHRRILAAKELGWKKIECVIMPFDSARDELYHSINANLRENMFYLDIAEAYDEAHRLGEDDGQIGKRVGVNLRTVRWYRRLTTMSVPCKELVRAHPNLFNATWAVRLARKGELPQGKVLQRWMLQMIKDGKTFLSEPNQAKSPTERISSSEIRGHFKGDEGRDKVIWARSFLSDLVKGGYFSSKVLAKIDKEVFESNFCSELKGAGKLRTAGNLRKKSGKVKRA